jgi:polyhydroxybutyrate depolymerase
MTRLAMLGLVAVAACSRADVYPITRDAPSSGGSSGVGGSSAGSSGSSGGGIAGEESNDCPANALPPGDSTHTVVVDGMARSYVLHVPPVVDGVVRAPLVLDFHGVGESGPTERADSPYPPALDPEGVVMAFPDGARGPAGTAWNVGPCCVADVDDVAFARAVVGHVQTLACIDASRVYAVGILTGGGLAHYLACHAADVFAAVAPAAFDLLEENVDDCAPSRPITVVSFRGTGESRVPYEGGPSSLVPGMPLTFLGARATFEKWAELNGCTGSPSAEDTNGCSSYASCNGGAEVVLCTKPDGREEPGEPAVAWPVMKRHTL